MSADHPRQASKPTCNVVMKGGITSGVVYPRALAEFARTYRLRSLGGASAGAIGAALGAAAEHGRDRGGFERLDALPVELADGRLAALFQPRRSTRALLPLLLAATGHDAPGADRRGTARASAVLGALFRGYPGPALLGALPGLGVGIFGIFQAPAAAVVLIVVGALLLVLGSIAGVLIAVSRTLAVAVPANMFGICSGLGDGDSGPGFTEWLSEAIDSLAGRDGRGPLLFGHLWTASEEPAYVPIRDRVVDLRMISTCVSQSRPYEMPWEARGFFFEPETWARLFPAEVMAALVAAPASTPPDGDGREQALWAWEDEVAAARGLRRLPDAQHLPVVVSVRLSLSFPLLISAVPLHVIDRRSPRTQQSTKDCRAALAEGRSMPAAAVDLDFLKVWFTDGGFCSNFPVHLFDEALTTRPTFAINLDDFPTGRSVSADQHDNVEYLKSNHPMVPKHRVLAESGIAAVVGFVSAALATSREWPDGVLLDAPGSRERVVRVLQSATEGGLNLFMDGTTIERLANRGRVAAEVLVAQFAEPRFASGGTGWDNYRWVRYRALLAALPSWLRSVREGLDDLDIDRRHPPSYSAYPHGLAGDLDTILREAAGLVEDPDRATEVDRLRAAPRPLTSLRRSPLL